jgi:hypothetical protein
MHSLQRRASFRLVARGSNDALTGFYCLASVVSYSNSLRNTAYAEVYSPSARKATPLYFAAYAVVIPYPTNQDSIDYSSSSTVTINFRVSALLHCSRGHGARYRISSSEHGHLGRILLHIRETEFDQPDTKAINGYQL